MAEMEWVEFSKFLFALIFVLALIGLVAWLARRFGFLPSVRIRGGQGQRLQVVEIANVDPKRKLLLVRCDRSEHLLLLGAERDLLIDNWPANAEPPVEPGGQTG